MASYKYEKALIVTTGGIDLTWLHMPAKDIAGNMKVIEGAHAELRKVYKSKASLMIKPDFVRLVVATKNPENADEVLALESIGCGLMTATKWGGP